MKDLLEIQEQRRKANQQARKGSAEIRREARQIINSQTILEKKEIKDNSNKAEENSQPLIVRYKKKKAVYYYKFPSINNLNKA